MMVKNYNARFNSMPDMTTADFRQLVQERRLWETRARFNGMAALLIMGPAPVGYHYPTERTYYMGYIVTTRTLDQEEARDIAARRGFGEEVVWIVEDTKPLGEQPMLLFKN